MTTAEKFVAPVINCNEAQNSGSCLLIAPLLDCALEPDRIVFETTGVTPANGVALGVNVTLVRDAEDNAVLPASYPDTYYIRKGAIIRFNSNVEVVVSQDSYIDPSAAVTPIAIEAPGAEIQAGEVTSLFADIYEITDATDLPINSDTQEDDRKVLKNGLQGSSVKTNISASVSLQMITNPSNCAQFSVLFKASQSAEDVWVAVVKSSGYAAFGRAKVMSYSITGAINSIERVSTTLNFQAPYAVTYFSVDPLKQPDADLRAEINSLVRNLGLPLLTV